MVIFHSYVKLPEGKQHLPSGRLICIAIEHHHHFLSLKSGMSFRIPDDLLGLKELAKVTQPHESA